MQPEQAIREIIDHEMDLVNESFDPRLAALQLSTVRSYLSYYFPLMFPEQENEIRAFARSYRKNEKLEKREKKTWKRFLIR